MPATHPDRLGRSRPEHYVRIGHHTHKHRKLEELYQETLPEDSHYVNLVRMTPTTAAAISARKTRKLAKPVFPLEDSPLIFSGYFDANDPAESLAIAFLTSIPRSANFNESYFTNDSLLEIAAKTESLLLAPVYCFACDPSTLWIQSASVAVMLRKSGGRMNHKFDGPVTASVIGEPTAAQKTLASLDEIFEKDRRARVDFWYYHQGSARHTTMHLEDPYAVHDELYPWLPKGYMDKYMASDACILFISGDPGTGKTSLLRRELCSRQLAASITYEEKVVNGDDMFLDFIRSDSKTMLVVEDADDFLVSREKGKNPLITRFLNFSDGLVKLPKKKIVFTTNLNDFSSVDPALMRKGRCFGMLESRKMTFVEAVKAAKAAGFKNPSVDKEYSLADLTHQDEDGGQHVQKIGFRAA